MVALNTSLGEVAIVAGARTPWAKSGTVFKDVHVADLAKRVISETLYRAGFDADRLDEVILGNVVMPADAMNLARVAALYAGVPRHVPGLTVQRNCASGLESISQAANRIKHGEARAIIAGGAESMSTIPLILPAETMMPMMRLARAKHLWQKGAAVAGFRPRHFRPIAALELGLTDPTCGMIMGSTADLLAHEWHISRHEQDEYALRSHQRVAAAADRLHEEITPYFAGKRFDPVTADNGVRGNQTMDALAKLKPIFDRKDGTVTVGNACQVTDGAAALLLMDAEMARAEGMEILGYVRASAHAALDPARMGLGPVYAIDKLLRQNNLKLSDIALLEINEAFAAQVLACVRAMSSATFAKEHLNREQAIGDVDFDRLNVNGGSIALGHPVGASGSRLVLTLLHEMRRRNVDLGIASLCVGGGQGAAILLERR